MEVPTRLSAAWVEADATEFEHIRFAISDVKAEQ